MDQDTFLTPRETSERLRERWQVRQSPARLANMRCLGIGPQFVHRGRWVLYPVDGVDAHGRSLSGPRMRSTRQIAEPAVTTA